MIIFVNAVSLGCEWGHIKSRPTSHSDLGFILTINLQALSHCREESRDVQGWGKFCLWRVWAWQRRSLFSQSVIFFNCWLINLIMRIFNNLICVFRWRRSWRTKGRGWGHQSLLWLVNYIWSFYQAYWLLVLIISLSTILWLTNNEMNHNDNAL